jgi:hypothetical protein
MGKTYTSDSKKSSKYYTRDLNRDFKEYQEGISFIEEEEPKRYERKPKYKGHADIEVD